MTFIVRGMRSDDATTAVRLRADTAVEARDLIVVGWQVFIECPDDIRSSPDDFDKLLSGSRDDSALPLRQTERDLDIAGRPVSARTRRSNALLPISHRCSLDRVLTAGD